MFPFSKSHLVLHVLFLFLLESTSSLSQLPKDTPSSSRRNLLQNAFSKPLLASALISSLLVQDADALGFCRPKARNCIRTTWEAPDSVNEDQVVETIRAVLNSYPQNGQNGCDCNGWSIVNDSLSSPPFDGPRSLKLEYRSCVGPAAVAINFAQPFVDDVILELGGVSNNGAIIVDVKSSSRMGSSDLFVNKKRVEYLGDQLRQYGWIVPGIRYGV